LRLVAGCPQTINLLPKDLAAHPAAVAKFLRSCPGLVKSSIGELLGENDDFFLAVLDEFTLTFDFAGERQDPPPPPCAERSAHPVLLNHPLFVELLPVWQTERRLAKCQAMRLPARP
jgi:Sec7 domain